MTLAGPWPSRARRLLALLATAEYGIRRREELINLLWPEAPPSAGASNLRHAVYQLRRTVGVEPAAVISQGGWVRLNPVYDWEIDVQRFEALIDQGLRGGDAARDAAMQALAEALQLYRGEPLPEERYDNWSIAMRNRAMGCRREAALRLAEWGLEAGDPMAAHGSLQDLVQQDPLDEEAVQALMRGLIAAGRPREARRVYEQFATNLEDVLKESPSPTTQALVAGLPGASLPELTPVPPLASPPAPALPGFIGREAELALVDSVLGTRLSDSFATAAGISLVLIEGDAGVGKTRLLHEVAERALMSGALVLRAACQEAEGGVPYGPIHDALRSYIRDQPRAKVLSDLGDLLPDLEPLVPLPDQPGARRRSGRTRSNADDATGRLRLFAAVVRALDRLAEARPMFLLLDDLHWADESTIELLHYVVRQLVTARDPAKPPLGVVGTYRPGEAGSALPERLQDVPGVRLHNIVLGPFTQEQVEELLSGALGGQSSPALTVRVFRRTAGNPFFALQKLRLLQEQGRLHWTAAGWEPHGDEPALPEPVRKLIDRRLQRLGPEVRELITLAAVLGSTFEYGALAAMWEGDDATLFGLLDRALEAGVLVESGEGYAFGHPLLLEVAYAAIPAGRRPLLHGRAGLALETVSVRDREAYAAQLAHHFWMARRTHPDRALTYLRLAGDMAARAYAWQQALEAYERAVQLAADDGTLATLLERMGEVLRNLRRYDDAIAALERAAGIYEKQGDLEGEAHVTAVIGWVYSDRGMPYEGIARVEPLLARFEAGEPSLGHAGLLNALLRLRWALGDYQVVVELATRVGEMVAKLPGPEARRIEARALMRRGSALAQLGDRRAARELVAQSVVLAEACDDVDVMTIAFNNLATYLTVDGRIAEARETLRRALPLQERLGDPARTAHMLGYIGHLTFLLGEWHEARLIMERALELDRKSPISNLSDYVRCCAGRLLIEQGDVAAGVGLLEEAVTLAGQMRDVEGVWEATQYLVEADLWAGRPDAARARIATVEELVGRLPEEHFGRWLPAWVELEVGEEDIAYRLLQRQRQAKITGPLARMQSRVVEGILHLKRRRWEAALQALSEAKRLAADMGYVQYEGRAIYVTGLVYLAQGELERGQQELEKALVIFKRLGATLDIARVEQALAGAVQTSSPVSGTDDLSR